MEEKSTTTNYNFNNPSVKRIMKEVKEMQLDSNSQYTAKPLEVKNSKACYITTSNRIICLSGTSQ
jgi:hypothetical protein